MTLYYCDNCHKRVYKDHYFNIDCFCFECRAEIKERCFFCGKLSYCKNLIKIDRGVLYNKHWHWAHKSCLNRHNSKVWGDINE